MYSSVRGIRKYYACGMSPATRIPPDRDVASYVSTATLSDGMAIIRRIAAGRVMLELPLDII